MVGQSRVTSQPGDPYGGILDIYPWGAGSRENGGESAPRSAIDAGAT